MKKYARLTALLLTLCLLTAACAVAEENPADAVDPEEIDAVEFDPQEELDFSDEEMDAALAAAMERVRQMRHILLLGVDARPGEKTGRTDTMVIVTLDGENQVIKFTSLMRDLYVEIPGRKNNRLNAAYVFGGPELLMKTIEANFGIHIETYVAVNFSRLAELIDQIGGLELTVESDYYVDRINAIIRNDNRVLGLRESDGLLKKSGTQVLTGKQAQAYARYRYGTKDGDFGRTARQREVLTKIFQTLAEKPIFELAALATANLDKVETNLGLDDILALAPALLGMKDAELQQLRIPVDGGYTNKTISGMAVLVPDRSKTKRAISNFLIEEGE